MLTNVFKNQKPASSIMALLIFAVLWIPGIISGAPEVEHGGSMPLYSFVISILGNSDVLHQIFSVILVWVAAIVFNAGVNDQDLFKTKNNLTLFFVVFLVYCVPEVAQPSPAIWALPFLALSLRELYKLYFDEGSLIIALNASLFLSIGWLMYFPIVVFFPVVLIASVINGYGDWRHITAVLIGFLAPPLIAFSIWVWVPGIVDLNSVNYWNALMKDQIELTIAPSQIPIMLSILITSVVGIVELALNLGKKRVSNRKNFLLMIWTTVAAMVSMLLSPANQLIHLSIMALPLALIIANLFYYFKKPLWSNVASVILLITAMISVFLA